MTKKTDKPAPKQQEDTPESQWYRASIKALDADRLKSQDERVVAKLQAEYFEEEIAYLRYDRMERETWDRARRTYDLALEVDEESAYWAIDTLSDWVHEDPESPITLRLMQPGGSIVHGLAIYDFVLGLRAEGTPVNTLTLGWCASMGSVIFQCGESRLMAPNSFMLIHETRTRYDEDLMGYVEKLTDAEDSIKFSKMLEEKCDLILAERSTLSTKQLKQRYARKDWWLGAEEAVELGFADGVWSPTRRKR